MIFLLLAIMLAPTAFAMAPAPMTQPFAQAGNGAMAIANASNGLILSNATTIYLYTFSLNGSKFEFYLSYISPNATGFSLNGSIYALYTNGNAVKVRSDSSYSFYAKLLSTSYYSKPQTAALSVYSVQHMSNATTSTTTSSSTAAMQSTIESASTTIESATTIKQGITKAKETEYGSAIIIILVMIALAYLASKGSGRRHKGLGGEPPKAPGN
ncbi:MAG: hypothetical protein ACREBH_00295 [Candidatus Micrarchaeaceae archaeon]